MIVNRIGDLAFALGIALTFLTFGSIQLDAIFQALPQHQNEIYALFGIRVDELIGVLLFIGAMGKSAQLFLHVWLPDAMEGPTPVSALIHAATMVTAGVFLMARMSPLMNDAPDTLAFIDGDWRYHGNVRGDDRLHAVRHQESHRLLDLFRSSAS